MSNRDLTVPETGQSVLIFPLDGMQIDKRTNWLDRFKDLKSFPVNTFLCLARPSPFDLV